MLHQEHLANRFHSYQKIEYHQHTKVNRASVAGILEGNTLHFRGDVVFKVIHKNDKEKG